jgi:hypothetical protein
MDGLARCGSVRAFDEPIPKVSGVTNGNARSQPRGQDAVCQKPEEEFVVTHREHLRWRLKVLRCFQNAPS